MRDWQKRIVTDPAICHGKPTMRGTRVMGTVELISWEEVRAELSGQSNES